jgi:hypothetical protein
VGFTKGKRKYVEEKMATKLKSKQTSIATVQNHLRTVASLLTPLIFHYSLPLSVDGDNGDFRVVLFYKYKSQNRVPLDF